MKNDEKVVIYGPNNFEPDQHFYAKVLNSQLHPMVSYFFNMSRKHIVERYTHLNPKVSKSFLESILSSSNKHFYWGGSDLFYVTTENGNRKMVVLETNSCPSGQKSMPLRSDFDEHRGYRSLLEDSFLPTIKKRRLPQGMLAIIYDKNHMEASGYAATLADITGEDVLLVYHSDDSHNLSFKDGIMYALNDGKHIPIRAALRYVTQKPWNRIPIESKTFIYNSTLVCISGGRNKLLASKAYELFNSSIEEYGLRISTPETLRDVNKVQVPLWVNKFGGYAVVKDPYSNAGQGVYTITSQEELDVFMSTEHEYDQFIVQSLIGHYNWSSLNDKGRLYHIGTMPDKKGHIYVADLRMMIYSTPNGFLPCAVYARRARKPLMSNIESGQTSWDILGTNLSIKKGKNEWDSDIGRLMQMDRKDFNTIGIGIDDLIEAYIQTVLSVISIDKMAENLMSSKSKFKKKLFASLDNDPQLIEELMIC